MQWRSHRIGSAHKFYGPLAAEFSYNVSHEAAVNKENPNPRIPKPEERPRERDDQPIPSREIDEFFHRLPANFRWPKPDAAAVAAAVEAIQRLSEGAEAQGGTKPAAGDAWGSVCSACGGALPAGARFCVWCGVAKPPAADDAAPGSPSPSIQGSGVQHHVHHHYHHVVPGSAVSGYAAVSGAPVTADSETPVSAAPRGRAPGSPGISTGGRAEAAARQVVQDWAQACNTKHIDDLLELYAPDATLIRSSVPPVRSLPSIREFLAAVLEAGLGDVQMESLRVEMLGDIALDLGRAKMLVPVAMGKRREERGKYLLVLVKQPVGTWKILADCWSSDLPVNVPPPEPAARKLNEPVPPIRRR